MDLNVSTSMHDGRAVVAVAGEVDVYTGPALRERLERELRTGHTDLVIDLSGVTFLDSTGLSVLVGRLKHARHEGGRLELVCPEGRVRQAFVMTGLDKIFAIHSALADVIPA